MPTFESINFCRELANRLVAIDSGDTVTAVDTPQALLSRPSQSLRLKNEDGTSLSSDPLHCNGFPELRKDVATKLVALSLSGKRQALMESVLQQDQQEQEQTELEPPSKSAHKFPCCISVVDMLKYQKTTIRKSKNLSTGSTSLDDLLSISNELTTSLSSSMPPRLCLPLQGLPWGHIIQCSGSPSTGKTQLALQVAVSAASQNQQTIYIASVQVSLRTLAQRFRSLACPMAESRSQVQTMMDCVSFQTVQEGYELLTCLAEIEDTCLEESSSPPRLVILDAASGCLSTEDETLLQRVVLRLKHLARHYNFLVWINNTSMLRPNNNNTNQRHSIDGTLPMGDATPAPSNAKPKVALGTVWRRVWDIHVALNLVEKDPTLVQPQPSPSPATTTVRATLEGHPFKKCNDSMTAEFCITGAGIQDIQAVVDEEGDEM